MTDTTVTLSIMDRLRTETAGKHKAAETHPVQAALATGKLSGLDYVRYLGQMLHVHRELERPLAGWYGQHPGGCALRQVHHDHEPDLIEDLEAFGVDAGSVKPGQAALAFAERIRVLEETNPLALLGYYYVLEGSHNGGRFLAKGLRHVYGLDGAGVRYLDPYGDQQHERWRAWKEAMLTVAWTPEEEDKLVEAAGEMFDWMGRIGDDVLKTG